MNTKHAQDYVLLKVTFSLGVNSNHFKSVQLFNVGVIHSTKCALYQNIKQDFQRYRTAICRTMHKLAPSLSWTKKSQNSRSEKASKVLKSQTNVRQ